MEEFEDVEGVGRRCNMWQNGKGKIQRFSWKVISIRYCH
jgi:hypothetical protein